MEFNLSRLFFTLNTRNTLSDSSVYGRGFVNLFFFAFSQSQNVHLLHIKKNN